jgi:hypothetical protein
MRIDLELLRDVIPKYLQHGWQVVGDFALLHSTVKIYSFHSECPCSR